MIRMILEFPVKVIISYGNLACFFFMVIFSVLLLSLICIKLMSRVLNDRIVSDCDIFEKAALLTSIAASCDTSEEDLIVNYRSRFGKFFNGFKRSIYRRSRRDCEPSRIPFKRLSSVLQKPRPIRQQIKKALSLNVPASSAITDLPSIVWLIVTMVISGNPDFI